MANKRVHHVTRVMGDGGLTVCFCYVRYVREGLMFASVKSCSFALAEGRNAFGCVFLMKPIFHFVLCCQSSDSLSVFHFLLYI